MASTPCRVLVVDDSVDSAESLTVLLELTGNETRAAYDGLEALEAAEQFRPDVILPDIGTVIDVARTIMRPWGTQIVLVALTGWVQEGRPALLAAISITTNETG